MSSSRDIVRKELIDRYYILNPLKPIASDIVISDSLVDLAIKVGSDNVFMRGAVGRYDVEVSIGAVGGLDDPDGLTVLAEGRYVVGTKGSYMEETI